MESFFSFLEKRVDDCSSLLCIGLDPHVTDLPAPTAASARDFCLNLVKQTSRYAAAFKPNAAFFEVFGAEGWTALKEVIEAIQEESNRMGSLIPVILDAKRGDIASTAEAYAKSAFENLGAHCITLKPLSRQRLHRAIPPEFREGCVPAVQDIQSRQRRFAGSDGDPPVNGPSSTVPLYEHVAQLAQTWNTKNNIGLVVGATHRGCHDSRPRGCA